MYSQGAKPTGLVGKLIGKLMNVAHTGRYREYFQNINIQENIILLDIGCGGGKFVNYLSNKIKSGKVYGLDHSEEMVKLSTKVNRSSIKKGDVEIVLGSVLDIPFEKEQMNMVTAFETIQFWPNLPEAVAEVCRVLKVGGQFIIMNQYPKAGTKWYDRVQIKSEKEYFNLLNIVGFKNIVTDISSKPGWIIVKAEKRENYVHRHK